nr:hypothetical protein [Bradyrhizobium japonicum]
MKGREGFIQRQQIQQHQRLVGKRRGKIRSKFERPIEARQCLRDAAMLPVKRAEVVVRFLLAGVQLDRLRVVGLRFLEPVQLPEAAAALLIQSCGIRLQRLGGVEGFESFGMAAEIEQQQRQVPDRVRIAGFNRPRFVKGRERFFPRLQAPQHPRLLVERRGKIRTKLERAIDARQGSLHPAKFRMKRPEVLVRLRLGGVERNGPLEGGLRFLEPAQALQAKAARLMQGCDVGIELREQVEAFQGFGVPAEIEQRFALFCGLQMPRQKSRCDRPGLLLGRGPTLLTIHKLTRRGKGDSAKLLTDAQSREGDVHRTCLLVPSVRFSRACGIHRARP